MMERCNCGAPDCKYCHPELDYYDICSSCGERTHASDLDEDTVCLDCRENFTKCDLCGTYYDPKSYCPECMNDMEIRKEEYPAAVSKTEYSLGSIKITEYSSFMTALVPACVLEHSTGNRKETFKLLLDNFEKLIKEFDTKQILQEIAYAKDNIEKFLK